MGDKKVETVPLRYWLFVRERMDPYVIASGEDLRETCQQAKSEGLSVCTTHGFRVLFARYLHEPPRRLPIVIDWDTVQEVHEVDAQTAEDLLGERGGRVPVKG